MLQVKEIEMGESVDDIKTMQSSGGRRFPSFDDLEEQKAQMQVRYLRGRQIACMIYEYFQVTGAHDTVLVFYRSVQHLLRYARF